MANPFDQFDAPATEGTAPGPGNVFDQFDAKPLPSFTQMSGAQWDQYFQQSTAGRILEAYGQGAANGWGAEPLGLSPETVESLRGLGVFNDYKSDHASIYKTFNEALLRGSAIALDLAFRRAPGLLIGGLRGVAEELPEEGRAGQIAALPFQAIAAGAEAFPGAHFTGLPTRISPRAIAEARSLNVIGPGDEAAWKGTVEPPPLTETETAAAAHAQVEAAKEAAPEPETPPATTTPPLAPTEAPAAPDIHAVARQIAPDIFRQYDALTQRRDTFRQWLDELGVTRRQRAEESAPHGDQIADLQERLKTANARMTKIYQGRLGPLIAERDAYIADAISRDTPDMTRVRTALQENDYRMRDLAVDVSSAYREAQARMPAPVAEPAPEAPPMAAETPQAASAPEAAPTEEAARAAPAEPQRTVQNIHDDAYQQLIAAGRPTEEANAAAALVQAHYEARAARFAGARGTPEEMYAADAPTIAAAEGGRAGAAGKTVLQDGRATISLFGKADASTFIHETGHAWLNEMLGDAADERSPQDLRSDADTVRKWLGAEPDAEITTRQHEKFARGFERYMMEGTAPSRALADVFAKFQQWLTSIYQTVARLRSPITDDIRDVFDRLLTTTPEKVIAPEREPGKGFAELHEADAEATPPEHATETADRIREERDEVSRQHAFPELDAERLTDRGGIAPAGGGARGGIPDRGGNAGQPEPAATGAGAEPRAVGAGGAATTPQRTRVAAATETPLAPNQPFAPADSTFIDKAGNIRLDNLNTPEDVNAVIRQVADENEGFVGARRGVISDAQVLDLADALGMDASKLDQRRLGEAFNAEQIMAARKLLVQSATELRDLASVAADGSEDSLVEFGKAMARHRMIQEQVAGLTAEAGRALRAFHALEGGAEARQVGEILQQSLGRTLYQMRTAARAIANLTTPGQVTGYVASAAKPGAGAMLLEIFKNWLISGPITHTTYSIGNALLALYKAVPETAAEAAAGLVREAITGQAVPGRVRFGEIPAQLYAIVKGQRDGWRAAYDSLKAGQTMGLPQEILDYATKPERARYDALRTGGMTHDQALTHMGINPNVATTPFTQTQAVPNLTVGGVRISVGSIVRAPGERMVAPIHSYFRTIGYIQSIARQAFRVASDQGLTGTAFEQEVARLTRDPTDEMMTAARGSATQQTLMGRGGTLTQKISGLVNWEPVIPLLGPTRPLAFIDPFVHISSNIVEQSVLERGPLGILTQQLRDDARGLHGTAAQDTAIARMALGTSLTAVGMGLAAEGLISPSAPSDPREAAEWRRVNGMPHSARIGGMSLDLSRLGVLGFQMGIAADLSHAIGMIGKEDASTIGSLLAHSFTQNFLDEGFMRGPSDLLKALDDSDRHGAQYVRNLFSSLAVPYSVGMMQLARQVDPYARTARSMLDAVKLHVPWWSETLFPQRDWTGQPIPNREYLGVYAQHMANDPVDQAMMRLEYYPAKPERTIRGVTLSDQQYDDVARIGGIQAKAALDKIVNSSWFASAPDMAQREIIASVMEGSRKAARAAVMMDSESTQGNQSILRRASEAKKALLHGVKPSEAKKMLREPVE